ncbi:unnamed protein product [Malus baccata var. baccata]
MASDRSSHGSVDFGPAYGLAWAGCQPIRLGWSKKRREWSVFQAGCQPISILLIILDFLNHCCVCQSFIRREMFRRFIFFK